MDTSSAFERRGPPRPGEWLYHFREEPQTFEAYVRACANRRSAERSTFCLQPLGDVADRHAPDIDLLCEYAGLFLGVPARAAPPLPLFESAHVPSRGRHNAAMLTAELARRVPPDALIYAGLTDRDLFSRGMNFVFGEGSLRDRAGVCSLHRLFSPDRRRFLRRALNLMVHEAGHILSIGHCAVYRCVMQGSNSLAEADARPMHLCPIDLQKLQWNTGFDSAERYRRLHEFYRREGFREEADWTARILSG